MKPIIHAVFVFLAACSALADNITVQSCSLKSSLPIARFLLDNPPVDKDKKTVTMPYFFCGVLNEQDMKKYCKFPDAQKATSTTILPNGASCHVKSLCRKDDEELKIKIDITHPKLGLTEIETSVYQGQGLLLRCQKGNNPKQGQVVVLKINKQKG